ncbi:MAG: putative Ig domain-containing protein [Treponema sp.]|nr:putative Ig domain-containing protein [Treponema sp.]
MKNTFKVIGIIALAAIIGLSVIACEDPAPIPPAIITTTLPGGTEGTAYTATLAATGDTPITWSIESGDLPAGLALAAETGIISGTPTATGTQTFTVKAANIAGDDTKELSIAVSINSARLVNAANEAWIDEAIAGSKDGFVLRSNGTYLAIEDSSTDWLPDGYGTWTVSGTTLTLLGSGYYGDSTGAISLSDNDNTLTWGPATFTRETVTITGGVAPTITTTALNSGVVSHAYSQSLAATGDVPYTWSIASGTLPAGLSLTGNTISGTPTATGTSNITIKVTNNVGEDTKAFSIVIGDASNLPIPALQAAELFAVAGGAHSAAIVNGVLYTWGANASGQLGKGNITPNSTTDQYVPEQIGFDTDWAYVAFSSNFQSGMNGHTLALKADGSLWAWGNNAHGRTGLGTADGQTLVPTQVGTDTDWRMVAAGSEHSVAIKADRSLWSWGHNSSGKLGQNISDFNQTVLTPQRIGNANDWASITVNASYSLAIKTDGSLWAWGHNNTLNDIGDGTNTNRSAPVRIGTDNDWKQVSASGSHIMAVKTNGTLWGWGRNNRFQIMPANAASTPRQVGSDTDWEYVTAGSNDTGMASQEIWGFTVAMKTDGTIWSWGSNRGGRTGLSIPIEEQTNTTTPTRIGTDTWVTISSQSMHTLAIKADGTIWGWGVNDNGRIGIGSTVSQHTPVQVTPPAAITTPIIRPGLYFKAAPILPSDVRIGNVSSNDLSSAVNYITNSSNPDGVYTLIIDRDVTTTGSSLNRANRNLTIIGLGGERTIGRTTAGSIFTLTNGFALTLGENITVRAFDGNTGSNLISLASGSAFTMKTGSKITGYSASTATINVVSITEGTFTMNGGEISGNRHTGSATSSMTAAVRVSGANSTFIMNGGTITDNILTGTSNPVAASIHAGGVIILGEANFTMTGGTITGNFRNTSTAADVGILAGAGTINITAPAEAIGELEDRKNP